MAQNDVLELISDVAQEGLKVNYLNDAKTLFLSIAAICRTALVMSTPENKTEHEDNKDG